MQRALKMDALHLLLLLSATCSSAMRVFFFAADSVASAFVVAIATLSSAAFVKQLLWRRSFMVSTVSATVAHCLLWN